MFTFPVDLPEWLSFRYQIWGLTTYYNYCHADTISTEVNLYIIHEIQSTVVWTDTHISERD